MIVAVHRGPCWAGPLARRLHAAGCPAGLPWPAGGWHVYELAPLETAIAQRLAGQVLAAGGWSALRPYAGASALLVGGNPLRLAELADARRYEEAALLRDRAGALAGALRRQRGVRALAASGRVRLRLPGGVTAELIDGILLTSGDEIGGQAALPFDVTPPRAGALPDGAADGAPRALSPEVALELVTVATWLDREAHRVRLESCDGVLASAWPAIPTFSPGQPLAPPKRLVA